jgi:hypothetical protein
MPYWVLLIPISPYSRADWEEVKHSRVNGRAADRIKAMSDKNLPHKLGLPVAQSQCSEEFLAKDRYLTSPSTPTHQTLLLCETRMECYLR